MEDVNKKTMLGQSIWQLSQQPGVSGFYVTPWEPLSFKHEAHMARAGELPGNLIFGEERMGGIRGPTAGDGGVPASPCLHALGGCCR